MVDLLGRQVNWSGSTQHNVQSTVYSIYKKVWNFESADIYDQIDTINAQCWCSSPTRKVSNKSQEITSKVIMRIISEKVRLGELCVHPEPTASGLFPFQCCNHLYFFDTATSNCAFAHDSSIAFKEELTCWMEEWTEWIQKAINHRKWVNFF